MNVAKEREVKMTMFLEHTVMVKFPILVITVNIKATTMFWPSVNSSRVWVVVVVGAGGGGRWWGEGQ